MTAAQEKLTCIEKPEDMGLRFVGNVEPGFGAADGPWNHGPVSGWYTDPYGISYKDGTGLCWGVVYQLPARNGRTRFVAGYRDGGCDGGPVLDLGTVYESEEIYDDSPQNHDGAIEAAHAADQLAQRAAEEEREYQTAWTLGQIWAEAQEETEEGRETRRAAIEGSGPDGLCVYMSPEMQAAFCDGADLTEFPQS